MTRLLSASIALVAIVAATSASADDFGSKAAAEQAVQSYLAMWSSDGHFDSASVARFYAPIVVYYGKTFSRQQVLRDKEAYIREWPVRHYQEVPGSLTASCNSGRTICKVSVLMRWRRVRVDHQVSTGQARLGFDFVPVEGGRKIARESARIVEGHG